MSSAERPAKRARQACDPCRRKKSRCPGEKPVCSYCSRLGQNCTYSDDVLYRRQSIGEATSLSTPPRPSSSVPPPTSEPSASDTARRLNHLEAKLAEVLAALTESRSQAASLELSSAQQLQTSYSSPTRSVRPGHPQIGEIPQDLARLVAELYLNYCHCQPLPLFVPENFTAKLLSRDPELVFAISATALRFSSAVSDQLDYSDTVDIHLSKARSLIQYRITDGLVELSTLQSLCLLSWVDFYDGNPHRASMYSSLAFDLCKSSDLANNVTLDDHTNEERLRCFWSIVLLQRLHPNVSGPFHICFDTDMTLSYPRSSPRPMESRRPTRVISDTRMSEYKDLGIVAYAIQLTEIWYKVIRYAHRRASAGPYPPWSPESDYARIIAQQMDNETVMPYAKHRFKPVKFEERTCEEIFQHRSYWGPWLFTQILYHTIICVLNHPLLLSLRLRSFRVASIPEIWLQHTDDLITQHSQWIILIIDLLEAKSFLVSDPFLAHCVAIVATIHLQQSFGGDGDIRGAKRENFEKCLRFCQKIGETWPYVRQIAQKLERFNQVVSDSYLNSATSQSNDRLFIDLNLFWEILESATIGERSDINGLTLGPSLRDKAQPATTAEEFNTQLLPEPARVTAAGTPANGISIRNISGTVPNGVFAANAQQNSVNDDFNVLAQSYFAQGQDFVGNMDDWWFMDDPNQAT